MEADVVAVIPTFRPSPEVVDLIRALHPMVGTVVVVDDASPTTFDGILRDISRNQGVTVVRFSRNRGIARSLNVGLSQARRLDAQWLLTVDQDSVPSHSFVTDIVQDRNEASSLGIRVGVIAPQEILDRSGVLTYPTLRDLPWPTTHEVLQSGALWSVTALSRVDGFDERLAIDAVDAEACLSIREIGYAVALSPSASLQHHWGDAKQMRILGRTVVATKHSPERRTSIVRNRLLLAPREFRQSPIHAFRTVRRVITGTALAATIEGDRWAKARASIRGLFHEAH